MFQYRGVTEKHATYALVGILLFASGYVGVQRLRSPAPLVIQPLTASPQAPAQPKTVPAALAPAPNEVVVHVAGAVKNPGLRRLPPGARVADAIHASGGPTAKADLAKINLAAKLVDGTQVFVPEKTKPHNLTSTRMPPREIEGEIAPIYVGGAQGPQPYLPKVVKGPAEVPVGDTRPPAEAPGSALAQAPTHSRKAKMPSEPVDLNTATLEQLETLPGVGPATAQKIIDYRQEHGRFNSIDELEAVKGIGPKKMEKMRPWLRV